MRYFKKHAKVFTKGITSNVKGFHINPKNLIADLPKASLTTGLSKTTINSFNINKGLSLPK